MHPSKILSTLISSFLFTCSAYALENVATSGIATQSSTGFGGVASRAIDGNTDGRWSAGSVTHTASDGATTSVGNGNNWWQVELDKAYQVDSISIWNRTDCCSYRLGFFTVSLFNGSNLEWSSTYGSVPNPSTTFSGIDKVGDRVLVQLNWAQNLSLAEVQVYAGPVPAPTPAAPVPEPESYAMLLAGLGVLSFMHRHRVRKARD